MIKRLKKYFLFKRWIIDEIECIASEPYSNPIEELILTRLRLTRLIMKIKDGDFDEIYNKMYTAQTYGSGWEKNIKNKRWQIVYW